MNAKYALALILALQVSMSLCEVPAPSQELVDKYESLKSVFFKRLLNAYGKIQVAAAPLVEKMGDSERVQATKTYLDELQTNYDLPSFVKVASALGQEAAPLVDTARHSTLGLYEAYVRPHVGDYLSNAINSIKGYLDKVLPAE